MKSRVGVNRGPYAEFIDPNVDLADTEWYYFRHNMDFAKPFQTKIKVLLLSKFLRHVRTSNIRQHKEHYVDALKKGC